MPPLPRRLFFTRCATAIAALLVPGAKAWALAPAQISGPHPTPRPGITGAKVATAEQLGGNTDLITLFDGIRAIPEIADGIGCNCGCATLPGYYSLLSCYEGADAMARYCPICQGQGRVAVRLRKAGKTLDEIRVAIDAQFG